MILFCATYLRSNVESDKLWRTKSVAIIRKFSHWLASFINRERRNLFSFLQPILIYVPNETEFKALGFYEPFERSYWIYFLAQPESTTRCPIFHDFVVWSPRSHTYTPKRRKRREKKPTTFLHLATLASTLRHAIQLSFVSSFFLSSTFFHLSFVVIIARGMVYFSARSTKVG